MTKKSKNEDDILINVIITCINYNFPNSLKFLLTKYEIKPETKFYLSTSIEPVPPLYEEFYTDDDEIDLQLFESLGVIKNARKLPILDIEICVSDLQQVMNSGNHDKQAIVESLKKHLPDFHHIETGKSLDQKM